MSKKLFIFFIVLIFVSSCVEKVEKISKNVIKLDIKDKKVKKNEKNEKDGITQSENFPFYLIGDAYFIDGIKYSPKEDYGYNEIGQAKFFDKEYHGKKTANNEIINITELIAAHKTVPLPSVIKITNLENNTALIVRVNDRGPMDNSYIISVSRRVAQLLNFYSNKTAKVKIEILEEESKQLKSVAKSINNQLSIESITPAPSNNVIIQSIE